LKSQIIIDSAGLTGFGLLIYGIKLMSQEAAFIVAGVLLIAFAIKAKVSK